MSATQQLAWTADREAGTLQNEESRTQAVGTVRVFAGWRAVVVGGSRGIGRAVTLGFAARGADVAACGRGREALDALADELRPAGCRTHLAACDVTDGAALAAFVTAAAEALGGLDVVVHCASAASGSNDPAWSACMSIDLLGGVLAADAALPFLRRSAHASVVNMASVAALRATPQRPAYGAIKAAVMHQTASSAMALAADGIRVNCVVAGSTEAPGGIWERLARDKPELYRDVRDSIPLGGFATADDIARVVFFLASPDAAWITGQSIVVDGGQSLVRSGP